MTMKQTPSQTAGPFFHYALSPEQGGYPYRSLATPTLGGASVAGERIRITGRIVDGQGAAMGDVLLEIWQADAEGRYAHPADPRASNAAFKGFGRIATDADGRFSFETVKPGPIGDGQAPHITVMLFSRGMQNHLYTRIYFDDHAAANARDPVLASVPPDRQATLIAQRNEDGYTFDIRVQGGDETVFFDV
jgi:protocatechuate 3,4-dioxygenase, alpha subunit